jgi:hypothetical protein
MKHLNVNSALAGSLCRLGFITELVFQNLPEQKKSNTTKHPLSKKVGRNPARNDVSGNNRFIFLLFHRRERAENENKQSDQWIEDPQIGAHEMTKCRSNSRNASKSPSRTGLCSISTAAAVAPECLRLIPQRSAGEFAPRSRDRSAAHMAHRSR